MLSSRNFHHAMHSGRVRTGPSVGPIWPPLRPLLPLLFRGLNRLSNLQMQGTGFAHGHIGSFCGSSVNSHLMAAVLDRRLVRMARTGDTRLHAHAALPVTQEFAHLRNCRPFPTIFPLRHAQFLGPEN